MNQNFATPNTGTGGKKFNTQEQMRTGHILPLKGKNSVVVKGNGSELGNRKRVLGRAKRKMISTKRVFHLIDIAKSKKDNQSLKEFWEVVYCQGRLITANGKQHGKYCGRRVCSVCNNIREFILRSKYEPVFATWPDPHLVVLTVKSVPARKLKWMIDAMYRAFHRINQKYQKRRDRGDIIQFLGFKTLECEFNPDKRWYNPHFNILVPNKEVGELLKMEWSKLWGRKWVNPDIQYCEPVYSRDKILLEVIKYCTKVFTDPDKDKKFKTVKEHKIYAKALYNIYVAMRGHRIFDRFGFNLPENTPKREPKNTEVSHSIKWKYDFKHFDWVGEDTAGLLTDFVPDATLKDILENRVDTLLE